MKQKDWTLEQEYFSWKRWDQCDTLSVIFYEVQFKKSFGVFSKGEEFGSIMLSYKDGIIEAY